MKTTEMYLGIKKETPQKIEVGWMLNTGKANNVKICIDATRTYNNTKKRNRKVLIINSEFFLDILAVSYNIECCLQCSRAALGLQKIE